MLYLNAHISHPDDTTLTEAPADLDAQEPERVQQLLSSTEFAQDNSVDYELVDLASQKFNEAVAQVPAARWAEQRAQYNQLQERLVTSCSKDDMKVCVLAPPPQLAAPAPDRQLSTQVCYWNGNGCGVPCLQRLAAAEREPRAPPQPAQRPPPPPLPPPPPPSHEEPPPPLTSNLAMPAPPLAPKVEAAASHQLVPILAAAFTFLLLVACATSVMRRLSKARMRGRVQQAEPSAVHEVRARRPWSRGGRQVMLGSGDGFPSRPRSTRATRSCRLQDDDDGLELKEASHEAIGAIVQEAKALVANEKVRGNLPRRATRPRRLQERATTRALSSGRPRTKRASPSSSRQSHQRLRGDDNGIAHENASAQSTTVQAKPKAWLATALPLCSCGCVLVLLVVLIGFRPDGDLRRGTNI